MAMPPIPRLVWNVSASAPVGLYAVGGRGDIASGDLVIARVPARWRMLAAQRRYIPANVPLVKHVAAVSGDKVCAHGRQLVVNGYPVATRRLVDGAGRPMPWWEGCTVLRGRAVFLLMDAPGSFDGRYFGVTGAYDIVGRAIPLWTR